MGFSFKKVFTKGDAGAEESASPDAVGSGEIAAPRQETGAIPSLPPPPAEGNFASPFDDVPDGLSPFDDDPHAGSAVDPRSVPAPAPQQFGGASPFEQAAPAQSPFEQVQPPSPAPAPAPAQPNALPQAASPFEGGGLPLAEEVSSHTPSPHDSDSTRELESKGFRPLSSLPNRGSSPPATPSMEPSSHDSSIPQRPTQPLQGGTDSPFESAPQRTPPAQSPFEIAAPESPAQPAWQNPVPPQQQQPPAPVSPFESDVQPAVPAPVPSGPIPTPPAPAPVDTGSQDLPVDANDDSREFVEMNVQQLLGAIPPAELGVVELAVSPFAKTRIPMAMLRPQLPTGQVFLNVSDVIVGCAPEHRAEMIGCNPTVRLRVPINLIFPEAGIAAPEAAPAPEQAAPVIPAELTPAPTPPAEPQGLPPVQPAADPFGGGLPKAPPAAAEVPASPFGDPSPAPSIDYDSAPGVVPSAPVEPAEEAMPPAPPAQTASASFDSPFSALSPLGGGLTPSVPTSPSPAEAPIEKSRPTTPDPASALPPMMPAGPSLQPTGAEPDESETATSDGGGISAGGWPFDGMEVSPELSAAEEIESLEDLPAVGGDGQATAIEGFENVADQPEDEQLTLRALFLIDEKIDADRVAEHCGGLPGIENSVVLGTNEALAGSSADFAAEAARLHTCVLDLTAAAGVVDNDFSTIRTSTGMLSFFAGENLAIGVSHSMEGFLPGVREHLTVLASELGNIAR